MIKKFKSGFTIIEISVAVAIVCILITLSVMATLQTRVRARDSKRISDATTIMNALESYYKTNQSYPTSITGGELAALGSSSLLPKLPSNPFPRTDGGCANQDYVYTTTSTGYQLTFCLGADHGRYGQGVVVCKNGNCGYKEDCSGEITDDEGIRYPIVRIGDQCWMAMHLKSKKRPGGTSCINVSNGGYPVDSNCMTQTVVHMITYNNAGGFGGCPASCSPIGSRRDCIKLDPPIFGPYTGDYGWTDRGVDKPSSQYEYPPVSNDSSCNLRGALYTWAGAMNLNSIGSPDCDDQSCAYLVSTPHRGICPQGWHIPTDQEFNTLEQFLTTNSNSCDANRNSYITSSCRDAGFRLGQSGDSEFNAILLGVREGPSGDEFSKIYEEVRFWTATESSSYQAIARALKVSDNGVYRYSEIKDNSAAVRCIRDY